LGQRSGAFSPHGWSGHASRNRVVLHAGRPVFESMACHSPAGARLSSSVPRPGNPPRPGSPASGCTTVDSSVPAIHLAMPTRVRRACRLDRTRPR
jgi:hypothetical protein